MSSSGGDGDGGDGGGPSPGSPGSESGAGTAAADAAAAAAAAASDGFAGGGGMTDPTQSITTGPGAQSVTSFNEGIGIGPGAGTDSGPGGIQGMIDDVLGRARAVKDSPFAVTSPMGLLGSIALGIVDTPMGTPAPYGGADDGGEGPTIDPGYSILSPAPTQTPDTGGPLLNPTIDQPQYGYNRNWWEGNRFNVAPIERLS
jgi:hypothetical protein